MTPPVATLGTSARWRRRVTQDDFDRFAVLVHALAWRRELQADPERDTEALVRQIRGKSG